MLYKNKLKYVATIIIFVTIINISCIVSYGYDSQQFANISGEYYFYSGAGAWGTGFTLNPDGTFSGSYHDANYASVDISEFNGKFGDLSKIDDTTYTMKILSFEIEGNVGDKWVDDGITYEYTIPYGFESADYSYQSNEFKPADIFYLYLPGSPKSVFDEDVLNWINGVYLFGNDSYDVTNYTIIYNKDNDTIFFHEDGGSLEDSSVKVIYNGSEITFDQPPIIVDNRTLVPLRAIFEAMGATVSWDQDTQTVVSTKGDITVILTIGNNLMYRNTTAIPLDVPAQVVNNRTLVPVRAISEAFGADVSWDNDTRTVIIDSKKNPPYFYDGVNILSEYNAVNLEDQLRDISVRNNICVAIVTVQSTEGKDIVSFADDFYDYNGYGYNATKDGIMLLIDIGKKEWAISTCGYGITVMSDKIQADLMSIVQPMLSNGNFYGAFSKFASEVDNYIKQRNNDAEWLLGSWTTIMYYGPDGTDYNLEQYAELNGLTTNEVVGQYTFNPDGTVDLLMLGTGQTISGTYVVDASSVVVTFAGQDGTFVLDPDGTLLNDNSAKGQPSVRIVRNDLIYG